MFRKRVRAAALMVGMVVWPAPGCDRPGADEPPRRAESRPRQGPAPAPEPSDRSHDKTARSGTRLVVLGSGTPVPDPLRTGPALAVVVGARAYLVDAGAGVVRRAAAAAQAGIGALSPSQLTHLFLTHLHSDHTLGLADVMLTPAVIGRSSALQVFGPPGLPEMLAHLEAAYVVDQRVRARAEGESPGYAWEAHVIEPGVAHRDDLVEVRAFAVPHGDFPHAFGFRFQTADRVIVLSGDTGPSDAVVDACDGCDLLVHEVYCAAGLATRPDPVRGYHTRFHTSGPELAALATRARPKQLLLTHLLPFQCSAADLLAEVRGGFQGDVVMAEDLGVY